MNRQIKFRAWHKTNKAFMYFELSELNDSMITKVDDGWYLEDCELMQFTGWHDHSKPAKEVYESDIVQFIDRHHGVVTWDIINDGWRIRVGNTFLLRDNEMIVIGNIYEHPNLLPSQE